MKEIKQTLVGKEIKRIRNDKGIKRYAFADSIGISDRHMSRIENTGQKLSVELIKKIAEELQISPVYLCVLAISDSNQVSEDKLSVLEAFINKWFED